MSEIQKTVTDYVLVANSAANPAKFTEDVKFFIAKKYTPQGGIVTFSFKDPTTGAEETVIAQAMVKY